MAEQEMGLAPNQLRKKLRVARERIAELEESQLALLQTITEIGEERDGAIRELEEARKDNVEDNTGVRP
jgi:uncharacterized coiled-coil DUF342 family protein